MCGAWNDPLYATAHLLLLFCGPTSLEIAEDSPRHQMKQKSLSLDLPKMSSQLVERIFQNSPYTTAANASWREPKLLWKNTPSWMANLLSSMCTEVFWYSRGQNTLPTYTPKFIPPHSSCPTLVHTSMSCSSRSVQPPAVMLWRPKMWRFSCWQLSRGPAALAIGPRCACVFRVWGPT